jgi:multidrug efflux pump subunit AcrA (membrane-fusion protein)
MAGELIADPSQMTTVEAPVAGRLARVDGGHWPAYGEHVDAGTILGQVSDAKPLTASRGGTVTTVGAQPGQMVQPGQVLLELHDFSAPLARIVWRADAPLPPPGTVELHNGVELHNRVVGHLVGPAPGVDSLTRLPAYLYRAEHAWPGASLGAPIEASVRGAGVPSRGLFVPAAAVVQWEGLAWVYVESAGDRYTYARERVDTSHPVAGGWLVPEGELASGNAVVVRGAQQLLSEEFKSRATTGDDDQQ